MNGARRRFADPALRLAPGLRMNLLFLGHRPEREIDCYLEAIRELCAAAPAPLVELGDVIAKGTRRPRLFTLPARSPEAEVLHIGLRSVFATQGLGFHEPEQAVFWPQVIVARVRSEGRPSRRPLLVRNVPDRSLPAGLREPFEGQSVGLYSSELRATGARHFLLGKAELPGATSATLNPRQTVVNGGDDG
jgi:hypothetical protein